MKKFIIWLTSLLIIFLCIDRIGGIIMERLYKSTKAVDEYKINSVVNKMNQPIVFMGSSRCHHGYIPSIISDSIGLPVYNAALWGERNIYFQYGLLCDFLERYTPKVICLELHPIDFLSTPYSDIDKISPLSPFIGLSQGCDSLFKIEHKFLEYKTSVLYRYNSSLVTLVDGMFIKNSQKDNGYKPLHKIVELNARADEFNFPFDKRKIQILTNFINKCKKRKIQLILMSSPMYTISPSCKRAYHFVNKFAEKNHLIYIDHLNDTTFVGKQKFFFDRGHFNDTGAKIYSSLIGHELKNYINIK